MRADLRQVGQRQVWFVVGMAAVWGRYLHQQGPVGLQENGVRHWGQVVCMGGAETEIGGGRKVRAVEVGLAVSGSFASLRMTAKTGKGNGKDNGNDNGNGKDNGKDNGNGKSKSEIRGFFAALRMTPVLGRVEESTSNGEEQIPLRG